jgi:signal transduction histidine kinase
MSSSGFDLSNLQDARLAPLATSGLPAWLWSTDATHIVWANPIGAAIFGASTSAAMRLHEFEATHPAAAEIARLAATLEKDAPPSIERLRGFDKQHDGTLTCACSHIGLRDGTSALLVVAAECAGPELALNERVHRLLAGSHERVAIYSVAGQLFCATQSAHSHLGGATTLAALGAEPLATAALADGYAVGRVGNDPVSINRLGGESATVLMLNFAAAQDTAPSLAPSPPDGAPRTSTAATNTVPPGEEDPSPPLASQRRAPIERRHPLRFVWQMDEHGRFTVSSDEFIELMGAPIAAVMGRSWADLAAELALDPEGRIARAVGTQDTWSGLSVSWPIHDGKDRLAVELSGLPVFDRERIFRGYRGFGVCREIAKLNALAMAREQPMTASRKPPVQETTAAAEESEVTAMDAPRENVVAFPANAPEAAAPALTAVEHMAFRELSRKLTQGLAAAGIEPDVSSANPAAREDAMAVRERQHVAEATSHVRPLLDRLPAGILVYRLNELLYANPLFLRWSGYRTLNALIEAGGLDELFIAPMSATGAGNDRSVTLKMDRGDKLVLKGELIDIDWEGEGAHALLALRQPRDNPPAQQAEIGELKSQWKRTEQELIEARRRAETASSAKSDFLARISHEIRTPLNSIIGFSEVMMEEKFGPIGNERYREYLKDVHSSGGHLLSLINDLLDLSKIEAGKLQLTFSGVALNDVAQQCVATMQPQANRERIIIRTALTPALPQVTADARSVRQIVLNLLSNSLKFTPAGGQVIVSTALNEDRAVVLRVRDTGVGMTENDLAAALEPFRQLATSPRGGTGLGLPLTKAMAEANGAKFHLTSTPKEGTLVEITFAASSVPPG